MNEQEAINRMIAPGTPRNTNRVREMLIKRNFKHGVACRGTKRPIEYYIWGGMRKRCNNKNDKDYPRYGGRGIRVCSRWNSFARFLEDMGSRPSPTHSLDRKDNNGDYTPSNCRWATLREQNRNKRTVKLYELNGKTYSIKELSEMSDIGYTTIFHRIRSGWSVLEAITKQPLNGNQYARTRSY